MKKNTQNRHTKIANDIKHYIYKHIDTDISLDELSMDLNISKFHMLRIFKKEFSQTIYESIKSIRLQKASMLLLSNKNSTITSVAKMCGYSSHAAFIRAFKKTFNMTPKEWKNGDYKKDLKDFDCDAKIVKMEPKKVFYIRHMGCDDSIKKIWKRLYTWSLINDITDYTAIGFFHGIPTLNSLEETRYTAGIIVEDDKYFQSSFPSFILPKVVHAKFEYKGSYEEFFSFISWVHFVWLAENGYETTPEPSFCIYKDCNFLDKKDCFEVSYYVCISI
jgi:AraC family transcriptional regulator